MQDLVDGYGQGDDNPLMSYGASSSGIGKLQVAENMWLQTPENYAQFKMLTAENTNFIFNPSLASESARFIIRAKPTVVNNGYPYVTGTSSWQKGMICDIRADGGLAFLFTDNTGTTRSVETSSNFVTANEWYYFCEYYDAVNKFFCGSVYDNNGALLWANFKSVSGVYNNTSYYQKLGGETYNDNCFKGYIDLKSVLFEIDGVPVWGAKTSAMQNMGKFDFTNPASFTKVDWLKSTGTQYIDTGFIPNNNSRFVLSVNANMADGPRIMGARYASGDRAFTISYYQGDLYSAYYNVSGNHPIPTPTGFNLIDKNKNVTSYNGNVLATETVKTFNASVTAGLFEWHQNAGWFSNNAPMSMEFAKIYDNGTIVRDYLPVYHTATGIRGMFDATNNKFYINSGTGTFEIPSDTSGEINLAEYLASLT
jgi:hypothetical protein